MNVEIKKVENRAELGRFIDFPSELYKGCDNWVPALRGDEFMTFDRRRNGAFEYCDADCFLAYRDGKIVGRVAALINTHANSDWKQNVVRFGWLDFIEDREVLKALLDTVAEWGKQRGCNEIKGPLGFTDMDKEGLLVEGYEHLSPFTCLYNYPYYDTLLKETGFTKDVDWTQEIVNLEEVTPPLANYTDVIEKRYGIHMFHARSTYELGRKYGMALFHMYNESFAPLFEFSPISDKQIKQYLNTYVAILDPRFVGICLNEKDEPVGFAFCVPSLSKAVKECGGRLFPTGFIKVLSALRKNDTLEALMIGVLPEYQAKGATVLLFNYIYENCRKAGIKYMILNPKLEHNHKVQSIFERFDVKPFMRRRSYRKEI